MNREEPRQIVTSIQFEKLFFDICYDRILCGNIGVDYVRMDISDVRKVRAYLEKIYEVEVKR